MFNVKICIIPFQILKLKNENVMTYETFIFYHLNLLSSCHLFTCAPRDKTTADKFMYIPNEDTQNCPYCRLQLMVET